MKKALKTAVAAAAGVITAGAAFCAANKYMHKDICMIAHRGYSAKYPGNTEPAFLGAVKNGSGGIETDIRVTADGIFVANHNDDVVFKDGTSLLVAEATLEELTAKPIRNDKTKDDIYICTFKRYLEICRDNNLICFIELKGEFTDEQINDVFTMAADIYDLKMCQLQSFEFENLVKAHEAFPDLKIMLTYGKGMDYTQCLEYGFDIDADYKTITKKMLRDFHGKGLKVGAWTANDVFSLNYCRALGVDFIESDIFGG
ncbi:MAG: hypothetical protein J6D06_07010 [Clostridia bacterium]|nr:hypothetical protein [Clostridia bacterium]